MKKNDERINILVQKLMIKYEDYQFDISDFEFINRKLVFAFSEESCDRCITVLFEMLKDTPSLSLSDIVILAAYNEERKLDVFLRYHKIKCKVINVKHISNLPFYDIKSPYFFVYDPNKKEMQSFFIPVQNNKQLTKSYLDLVSEKLNRN